MLNKLSNMLCLVIGTIIFLGILFIISIFIILNRKSKKL